MPWPGCVAGLPNGPNRPRFPPARHAGGRRPRPWVVVVGGGHPGELTHRPTRLPAAAWLPGPGPARQTRPGSAVARARRCRTRSAPRWSGRPGRAGGGPSPPAGQGPPGPGRCRPSPAHPPADPVQRHRRPVLGPVQRRQRPPLGVQHHDVCATRSGAPDGAAAPTHTRREAARRPAPQQPDAGHAGPANPGSATPDSADPGRGTPKPVAPCLVPRWGSVADAEPERAGLSTGPRLAATPAQAPPPVTPARRRRP